MAKDETVWVVMITHKHGVNVHARKTREGARQELFEFANQWWADEFGDAHDKPDAQDEVIDQYFEKVEGREHYDMEQVPLGS